MGFNYLVNASNEMFEILGRRLEPTADDLKEFFALACNTLKRLETDGEFSMDVSRLAKEWTNNPDVLAIVNDVRHFTDGFLQIEEKVMRAAGFDGCTWVYVREAAEQVRAHVARKGIHTQELANAINYLQRLTCDIANRLSTTADKRQARQSAAAVMRNVAFGVSGAALIWANASSVAVTVGLSTAGAAVSAAVGTGFLTRAVERSK